MGVNIDQEPAGLADWFLHRAAALEKIATQRPDQAENYRKLAQRFRMLGTLAGALERQAKG